MYDNEDEIKKKRRKLFIIIAVIVLIIIILLIFLLTRGGNKKPVNENKELKCELEVKSGTLGENGVYTSAVEIGFKSITAVSKDIEITKNTVGVNDNSRNKETFTVTKQGTYTVYGYIQDAAGNKGTCSIEVKVDPSKPTCELEVKKGTLGNNDWYTTDVEVGFKSMETNSETAKIEKFYLEKEVKLENDEVVRAETPTDNIDKLIIKDNQTTVINGYVIDSNGTEGSCTIVIKKDSETGSVPQGDATFNGAVYKVYASEDIYNKAKTKKFYSNGDLVATRTMNEKGETEDITNLPLGKYVVKEETAPIGYMLDKNTYNLIQKN